MTIPADVVMMVNALFPGNKGIREAPTYGTSVRLSSFDAKKLLDYMRGSNSDGAYLVGADEEDIPLEEIAESVYAGMSQRTKIVYVRVGND